jgi:ABC-type molybdate transport system substrate-binding protein
MTNNWKDGDKLPVVGKRYRLQKTYLDNNNNKTTRENKKVIVTEIEEREVDYIIHYKDDDGITNCLSSISFLGLYYEEDSEDNLQKIKEVSEVDKALEELKKNIKLTNYNWLTSIDYENLKQAAQNLVDALESEKNRTKPEPEITVDGQTIKFKKNLKN